MTDRTEQPSRNAPAFYASGIAIAGSGTDMKLIFMDNQPGFSEDGEMTEKQKAHLCGVVTMSFHTAKDLHALLGVVLSQFEEEFGKLDTPFLKDQRDQNLG